jgi:hypothetical protein
MTATTARHGGGGALFLLLVGAVVFLGMASLALEIEGASMMPAEGQVIVPPAIPSSHALAEHGEDAQTIFDRYEDGDYACLRVYTTSQDGGKSLFRFSYRGTNIEGGIIATLEGRTITAFPAPASYWDNVLVRDGYTLAYATGACATQ